MTKLSDARKFHTLCGGLLCGGGDYCSSHCRVYGYGHEAKKCQKWTPYKFENTSVTLKNVRNNHLCWEIDNGVLLLGGDEANEAKSSKTTELVVGDGSSSVSRFDLIFQATDSCGIDREDGTYVITGGQNEEKRVVVYTTTGFKNNLPDLLVGRYKHSCSKFVTRKGQMALVVTGGRTAADSKPMTSTEMYIDGSWSTVPAYLPVGVISASCVTLDNQVFLFGGTDGSRKQAQILKLTPAGGSYRWEGAGVMKDSKSDHAVGVIPEVSRICP